ncbi:MAG: hypothetical protein VW709_13755 [Rickettsiales bacterium]
MARRELTIALERYDRHVPFLMGMVETPPEFALKALEVGMVPPRRDGVDRHKRMLVEREFDIAEVSMASYILSKRAGAPFSAVPVFPRRLFSQNHILVNTDAGIEKPSDLIGRKVAIWAWQVTMSVLAKGDLQADYGLPWRDVQWFAEKPEEIDWDSGDVPIQLIPAGKSGPGMLLSGEVDAYINPHPPEELFESPKVRRLFRDPEAECLRHFERYGCYPIMHVLAFREELAVEFPNLPGALMTAWDDARAQAEEAYVDFNYTMMPFGRYAFEANAARMPGNLWPSGLAANRRDLERFVGYMVDQQLLDAAFPVEELFHPAVTET